MRTHLPLRHRFSFVFLLGCFLLLLIVPRTALAQTETEPNNSFATANAMTFALNMSGGVCASDNDDYFRCVVPAGSKSLRLITTASMTTVGQTGSVFVYLYNKFQQQLINKQIALTATALTDTMNYTCFEGDTFYVRVLNWSNGGQCKQYTVRCETSGDFTLQNDTEVNDDFNLAIPLAFQQDTTGHVGSQRYVNNAASDDYDDYYRLVIPAGGKSLRLITSTRTVQSGASGSVFYYIYNKFQQELINRQVSLNNTFKGDTLDYTCFEGDTFYVRVRNWSNAAACKEYKLRVDYTGDFTLANDKEVNDNFATAIPLAFQQDTTGHVGSQRYVNNAASDDYDDYYRLVIPAGGKSLRLISSARTVQGGATGSVFYYLYNKFQQELINRQVSLTNAFKADTLNYTCFEGDTFYVRVRNWSNAAACKEYKIRVDYTGDFTLANDKEVNDNFATAIPLAFQQDTTGHLGSQRYVNNAAFDDYDDYYRLVIPAGGKSLRLISSARTVQGGATGSIYYYLYNKFQQELINRQVTVTNTLKIDTLNYTCFEGDTFYVRVRNWSNAAACKEYKIRVDYTGDFTLANDSEVNDDFTTATTLPFEKDTTGHLGSQRYANNAVSDDYDDYYRFVGPPGMKSLRLIASARTVQPGATGSVFLYIYNKQQQQAINKQVILSNTLTTDTLQVNCFSGDTLYVRVRNWSNASACKEYRIKLMMGDVQPVAKILAARTGSEFGFVAETKNADWIEWDFDNGVKSNVKYPTQTFGAGGYNVKLRARNTNCSVTSADSLFVEVKGVEGFKPAKAGAGGDLLMSVFGGGLDTSVRVRLIRGSEVLQPVTKQGNAKRNMLTADFDLHFATPGLYDVEIVIPGEAPFIFPQGFEIEPFRYPFAKAEVVGPNRWRINRDTRFELKVSNSGNVNGRGVVIGFAYPKSVTVDFLPKQTKLDRTATTTIAVDGEVFTLSNAVTAPYADSASRPFPIDSLQGEPYDGYLIYLTLSKLPYNGTVTMPFTARTTSSGNPSFYTFTHHPNIFGSCETPHWSNTTNMMMAEGIDALDMVVSDTKAPGIFKAFTKSLKIGQKHLAHAGASAGAHFDAWWNGYEVTGEMYGVLNAELDEANAYALQTATDELGQAVFDKSMGKLLDNNKVKNEWWNKQMANNQHLSPEDFDQFIDKLNALDANTKRLEQLKSMLKDVKDLKTLNDKINTLQKLVEDCPELEPQLVDLLNLLGEELDHKDPNKKPTQSVQSMDPNAIYGPEGVLGPRYRKDGETMHYMVTCENMDTATAPAQVVRIVDTLNPALFDLSTFEFGNIYIGNKSTRLLSNRDEFFGTLSLYPEIPLVAHIVARLDKTTGVITWDMVGIDTNTKDLPADPDLGILPPNKTAPMGEAGVNYSVKLKAGLPSGTAIANRALIYFDENEPIFTNTWLNTLDIVAPQSNVLTPTLVSDTLIRLKFNGADAESGVAKYRIHVKVDTANWKPLGIVSTDTMYVAGDRGKTYHFYVSALDHVGNAETKPQASEANVTVPLKENPNPGGPETYSVYPNPTTGQLFILTGKNVTGARLMVSDVTGRVVMTATLDLKAGVAQSIDLSSLANGVYPMAITGPGMPDETFKILLAKPER
jgi:hypothetical protein